MNLSPIKVGWLYHISKGRLIELIDIQIIYQTNFSEKKIKTAKLKQLASTILKSP
jgi:hypothetical protein